MKLGIFGGTFDPFTLAHRDIVKTVLEQKLVDFVVVAPTIVSWHREGKTRWLDDKQKVKVIQSLLEVDGLISKVDIYIRDLKRREICVGNEELEKRFVEQHRFIDTLLDIKMGYGDDCELYPIIGSDSWEKFETWSNWKEIASMSQQILVANGREGSALFTANPNVPNATWFAIDSGFANVSSTDIRNNFTSADDYIACMFEKLGCAKHEDMLLHTPIFDVIRGEETSTGLKPFIVNAPDWVSIMVEREGKLLVEKQFRYGANDFVEEFPCGMVENDEDPLDAVVRELEEETGIKLLDKTEVVKLGQTNPNPAFMTNMMHYYYMNLDNAKWMQNEQKLDEYEELECYWRDKSRFMFDLADDAHACGKKQVPAIALAMVKLYENASNYPSCG